MFLLKCYKLLRRKTSSRSNHRNRKILLRHLYCCFLNSYNFTYRNTFFSAFFPSSSLSSCYSPCLCSEPFKVRFILISLSCITSITCSALLNSALFKVAGRLLAVNNSCLVKNATHISSALSALDTKSSRAVIYSPLNFFSSIVCSSKSGE